MLLGFARYRQLSPRRGAGRRKAGLREADGERAAYAMIPGSRGIFTVDYQRDRKARLVVFTPGAITTPGAQQAALGSQGSGVQMCVALPSEVCGRPHPAGRWTIQPRTLRMPAGDGAW